MYRSQYDDRVEPIMTAVATYWDEHGYGPSVEDIRLAINAKTKSTVHRWIVRMVEEGMLDRTQGIPRTLRIKERL